MTPNPDQHSPNSLTITTPDDWHVHFRDDDMLAETLAATGRFFARAIAMPNLIPPVTTVEMALAYRQRLLAARATNNSLEPLVTLFLTNTTTPETIAQAAANGIIASKLYPAGATTNSSGAVASLEAMDPVFAAMAEHGMILLIHGEVTDPDIDIFDREKIFIERHLQRIVEQFPNLKIVAEHITTKEAAEFITQAPANVAATITPQHLLLNRNDLLVGGVKPHNYCLPILKRNIHQEALRATVASGSPQFFMGTDSAPHLRHKKESACGCAGCYSAWSAIELYAEVFTQLGCLDKLEAFCSHHGADFYGLPRNTSTITLEQRSWSVPDLITMANGETIVPFYAGRDLQWRVV